jgi:hypothetical protein
LCINRWITVANCGQLANFCGQDVDSKKLAMTLPQTLALHPPAQ